MTRVLKLLAWLTLAFLGAILGLSVASATAAAVLRPRLLDDATPEDDDLVLNAVYAGREFRSAAPALRSGRVVCWYSGLDLDLRGARLDPVGATLEVWTVFGGARIRVPEDWAVRIRGVALFGAASSDTTPTERLGLDAPTLTVRHRTLFGGLGVAAEPDEPQAVA